MSGSENSSCLANATPAVKHLAAQEDSPDKPALKQRCKKLEAAVSDKEKELEASKSAFLQFLESCSSGGDSATPAPSQQSHVRQSVGSVSSILAAPKQNRHGADAHDYVQQLISRDKIIADLRGKNQALKEEMHEVVLGCQRLQEVAKQGARMREQHAALIGSIRNLKQQVEKDVADRKRLEAEIEVLQNKVKHEASKNTMHRENERIMDNALASKQELLDKAHDTLAVLHDRFGTAMQTISAATSATQDLDTAAGQKAATLAAAQSALEYANADMQRLTVRCTTLFAQLAHERDSKKAVEKMARGLEHQLQQLQTAKGVAVLAARAGEADFWQHKAAVACEQRDRLKGSYQKVRQQYAELRRQLDADTQESEPDSPAAAAGAIVVHTPTPAAGRRSGAAAVQAMSPLTPQLSASQVPLDKKSRAALLKAEVASIRGRISMLRDIFGSDLDGLQI